MDEGTEIARRPGSQPYLELLQKALAGLDWLLEVRMRPCIVADEEFEANKAEILRRM